MNYTEKQKHPCLISLLIHRSFDFLIEHQFTDIGLHKTNFFCFNSDKWGNLDSYSKIITIFNNHNNNIFIHSEKITFKWLQFLKSEVNLSSLKKHSRKNVPCANLQWIVISSPTLYIFIGSRRIAFSSTKISCWMFFMPSRIKTLNNTGMAWII